MKTVGILMLNESSLYTVINNIIYEVIIYKIFINIRTRKNNKVEISIFNNDEIIISKEIIELDSIELFASEMKAKAFIEMCRIDSKKAYKYYDKYSNLDFRKIILPVLSDDDIISIKSKNQEVDEVIQYTNADIDKSYFVYDIEEGQFYVKYMLVDMISKKEIGEFTNIDISKILN